MATAPVARARVSAVPLGLRLTAALDEFARRLEPPNSAGLDPAVLPEAPGGLWRLRVLHARNLKRRERREAA
jgi:hypothetical protein